MSDCNFLNTCIKKESYAVDTVVRHEKTVNSSLAEKDIVTFLPIRDVVSHWKDRRKRVKFSFFPGGLFVNMILQDRWSVLNTRGVVRILGVYGNTTPVPFDQIDAIIREQAGIRSLSFFTQGREIVVINGPPQPEVGPKKPPQGGKKCILTLIT